MNEQLSLTEQLMYSTIRIECDLLDGRTNCGTGFMFNILTNKELNLPVIVTNKHVVKGAIRGRFRMTKADDYGNPIHSQYETFDFDDFENKWLMHPESDVDLCIMPINHILNIANSNNIKVFYKVLDKSMIPSDDVCEDFTAMEDIIMIGYPNGIWDEVNNLPLFRKGITATHPKYNFNGRQEFIIDAACFPGSSGSPVLLFNQGAYQSKSEGIVIGKDRLYLLGVLYAGPQHTITGEIKIVNVPTSLDQISESRIPNNLGIVIKSNKLLDFDKVLWK